MRHVQALQDPAERCNWYEEDHAPRSAPRRGRSAILEGSQPLVCYDNVTVRSCFLMEEVHTHTHTFQYNAHGIVTVLLRMLSLVGKLYGEVHVDIANPQRAANILRTSTKRGHTRNYDARIHRCVLSAFLVELVLPFAPLGFEVYCGGYSTVDWSTWQMDIPLM